MIARWEEIEQVSVNHPYKFTLNGFTGRKDYRLYFKMRTGAVIDVKLIRLGFLWGIEFIYHNHKINQLIKLLASYTKISEGVITSREGSISA